MVVVVVNQITAGMHQHRSRHDQHEKREAERAFVGGEEGAHQHRHDRRGERKRPGGHVPVMHRLGHRQPQTGRGGAAPRDSDTLDLVHHKVQHPAQQAGDDQADVHLLDGKCLIRVPDQMPDTLVRRKKLGPDDHQQREAKRQPESGEDAGQRAG